MLSASPLRSSKIERDGETESFLAGADDFSGGLSASLLDDITFEDLFVGMEEEDVLPDLELDPELLAEFPLESSSSSSEVNASLPPGSQPVIEKKVEEEEEEEEERKKKEEKGSRQKEELVSQTEEPPVTTTAANSGSSDGDRARKSATSQAKGNPGKKKAKVIK